MKFVKWKYPLLAFLFVAVLLSVILPIMLNAQTPDIPMPTYMPGERPPHLKGTPIFSTEKPKPTATANVEEMKLLPKVTPPVLPTAEFIDLAPELDHQDKFQITIRKPDGTIKVILYSPNMDQEEALQDTLDFGKLSACRHANGRDWWIIVARYTFNEFHRFLLTPTGLEWVGTQQIGDKVIIGGGQAFFTPDGNN